MVLEWHADERSHGVLQLLGQFGAIGFERFLGLGGGGEPHQYQRREHDDRRGVYHSPLGPFTQSPPQH